MPLVFFCAPNDPRMLSTLRHILKTPERGGLTANSLVFRYDHTKAEDGVGGEEGAFSCVRRRPCLADSSACARCACPRRTSRAHARSWAIEALARAGAHEPGMLDQARAMFESFMGFANHSALRQAWCHA